MHSAHAAAGDGPGKGSSVGLLSATLQSYHRSEREPKGNHSLLGPPGWHCVLFLHYTAHALGTLHMHCTVPAMLLHCIVPALHGAFTAPSLHCNAPTQCCSCTGLRLQCTVPSLHCLCDGYGDDEGEDEENTEDKDETEVLCTSTNC